MCVYVKEGHVPESLDEIKNPPSPLSALSYEKRKEREEVIKKKKKEEPKLLRRQ